jgi:hypothetical protein
MYIFIGYKQFFKVISTIFFINLSKLRYFRAQIQLFSYLAICIEKYLMLFGKTNYVYRNREYHFAYVYMITTYIKKKQREYQFARAI